MCGAILRRFELSGAHGSCTTGTRRVVDKEDEAALLPGHKSTGLLPKWFARAPNATMLTLVANSATIPAVGRAFLKSCLRHMRQVPAEKEGGNVSDAWSKHCILQFERMRWSASTSRVSASSPRHGI